MYVRRLILVRTGPAGCRPLAPALRAPQDHQQPQPGVLHRHQRAEHQQGGLRLGQVLPAGEQVIHSIEL